MDKLRDTLKQLKQAELKRKKDLSDTEDLIKKLQKAINEGPPEPASADLVERLRAVLERLRDKGREITDVTHQHGAALRDIDNAMTERKRIQESYVLGAPALGSCKLTQSSNQGWTASITSINERKSSA